MRHLRPDSGHTLLLTVLHSQVSPVCPTRACPGMALFARKCVLPSPRGRPYTREDTTRSSSSGPCRLGRTGEFGAGARTLLIPALPEPRNLGRGSRHTRQVPRQLCSQEDTTQNPDGSLCPPEQSGDPDSTSVNTQGMAGPHPTLQFCARYELPVRSPQTSKRSPQLQVCPQRNTARWCPRDGRETHDILLCFQAHVAPPHLKAKQHRTTPPGGHLTCFSKAAAPQVTWASESHPDTCSETKPPVCTSKKKQPPKRTSNNL